MSTQPGERPSDERLTRNWNELLQEIRVAQTGVQILTGFLLTLPFTERFGELEDLQRNAYLAVLVGAVLATGLLVGPAAFHRLVFRRGQRYWLVQSASVIAIAGLVVMAITTSGIVWLVFDVVIGGTVATIALVTSLVFFATLWGVVPLVFRNRLSKSDRFSDIG